MLNKIMNIERRGDEIGCDMEFFATTLVLGSIPGERSIFYTISNKMFQNPLHVIITYILILLEELSQKKSFRPSIKWVKVDFVVKSRGICRSENMEKRLLSKIFSDKIVR